MTALTLEHHNRDRIARLLKDDAWVVACLCAAWCDVCCAFRAEFDALAARHPGRHFIWIDIEDQADMLGDIDVENFPTLLIQRGAIVTFFGAVLPDQRLAERLLQAQVEKSDAELHAEANSSELRRGWQQSHNLRELLELA